MGNPGACLPAWAGPGRGGCRHFPSWGSPPRSSGLHPLAVTWWLVRRLSICFWNTATHRSLHRNLRTSSSSLKASVSRGNLGGGSRHSGPGLGWGAPGEEEGESQARSCAEQRTLPARQVRPGRGPTSGPNHLSPLAQGLAHAEAHALQDRQAHLLSLEGGGREAQGPSATSNREPPGVAEARGPAIPARAGVGRVFLQGPPDRLALSFHPMTPQLPHTPPRPPPALRTRSPSIQEKCGLLWFSCGPEDTQRFLFALAVSTLTTRLGEHCDGPGSPR